jgi:formylglycine-generating enzyme required for sulfatase activity
MKKKIFSLFCGVAILAMLISAAALVSCSDDEENSSSGKSNRTFNVNGVEFKMVYVEGGTFMMGSDDSEAEKDEQPVHKVSLNDYYIGETEVTQELWLAVMGSNPSCFEGVNRPVEQVSWYDCKGFIAELNRLTGESFCLPTEAQWEFAARGGIHSKGYEYSGSNGVNYVGWYCENVYVDYYGTQPVATKQSNELGIYDMSGNVWEWCEDWRGEYTSNAVVDPQGPTSGSYRVLRGGCWKEFDTCCRCTLRCCSLPTNTLNILGLRLALK